MDGLIGSILELDQSWEFIDHHGQQGRTAGPFLMPHAIAVSSDNKLYVAAVTIN